jgi:hypothetical protein
MEQAMPAVDNGLLTWVFAVCLLVFIGVPAALWTYQRAVGRTRRKLEQSKRPIAINADERFDRAETCPHKRSKSRAKTSADGTMRSICRFCGVPMVRKGPGEWDVVAEGPGPRPSPMGETNI